MEDDKLVAEAIHDTLTSATLCNRSGDGANITDVVNELAIGLRAVGKAITDPSTGPGKIRAVSAMSIA